MDPFVVVEILMCGEVCGEENVQLNKSIVQSLKDAKYIWKRSSKQKNKIQ